VEHRTCLRNTVNVHNVLVRIFKMEETNWNIVYSAVAQSSEIHCGEM